MPTRDDALTLDRDDPLAWSRERFHLPDGVVYLDGNSLGAQVRGVPAAADGVLVEWRDDLIGGWFDDGWWELPLALGDRIGELLGAGPGQTVVCDTTTLNLYKVLNAALGLRPDRRVVLVEESSFPTDRYVVDSVAAREGREVRVIPTGDSVAGSLDDDVAVAVLNHVDFRTAALVDMAATTEAVQKGGALVIWDVSHSAGVVPIDLERSGADFAIGCTYKYLNGGPGSPAFIYAADRHIDLVAQPVQGWLGHADPFEMSARFVPAPGVRRFLTGTPPIVSMRMLAAALDAYDGVTIDDIRAKSIALTDFFMEAVDEQCDGYAIVTPRDGRFRGSQVSLRHPDARDLHERLVDRGLRGDHRNPGLLRFGFAPLYNTFTEVWDAVQILAEEG